MAEVERFIDAALDVVAETRGFLRRTRAVLGSEAASEERASSVSGSPARELADERLALLNGMWGDRLDRRAHPLAAQMSFRHEGRDLPLERARLAEALPAATSKVVVFVHGWSCTESVWLPPSAPAARAGPTYGDRLREELGYTPLYVRYNTGRHVSENGRSLAALLQDLSATYPGEFEELVLVGHSMGGLVVRSAAHHGDAAEADWVSALRHVVCLGSPHLGSTLEQGAHLLTSFFGAIPNSVVQTWADILKTRSSGVKDLRFGYIRDEEWLGRNPDAFLEDGREGAHLVEGASYHYVAATLTRAPDQLWGRLVGDVFVRAASAAGSSHQTARRIPFESGRVLGGLDHFALARDPEVYAVLQRALGGPPNDGR